MATQQLPTQLPPGWESDYDGTSERWFFVHRPTGFSQYFFPKDGDEKTRIAELAQPQPTTVSNASLTIKMEAMTLSESTKTAESSPQPLTMQTVQVSQTPPTVQPTSTPQPSSVSQQSPVSASPLSRTISGSIQRKAIPRRPSAQSQASIGSNQNIPQTTSGYHPPNSPIPSSTMQNIQTGQQPQVALQSLSTQPTPLQVQSAPIHYQNPQPQQIFQPHAQPLPTLSSTPTQNQIYQTPGHTVQYQYQQPQPLHVMTGQPLQHQVQQSSQPIAIQTQGEVPQHAQSAQQHSANPQMQQQQHYPPLSQTTNPQFPPQYSNPQQQQPTDHQFQPQSLNSSTQSQPTQHDMPPNQRRFSTIPVSHQEINGQIPSPIPQNNQGPTARHSSIGNGTYQSPPLFQQMHPIPSLPGQPIQYVPVDQNHIPQIPQANPIVQAAPAIQYVQQNVAPLPPSLPPPAPGMQWVLVQPGNPQPQVPPAPTQTVQNPNQSSSFSVQMQQFQGGAQVPAARPSLVTRLSASTVSGSKKAFDSSKGFIKKHPGKTMAVIGGLGVVAEACGVSVLSDAVAGTKIYANVQNAKARRKALMAATSSPANTPAQVQSQQAAHPTSSPTPNVNVPGAQYAVPQATQQAAHVLYQHAASPPPVGITTQPTHSPVHQIYQPNLHPQTPISPTHHQQQLTHLQQEYFNLQNAQSSGPPAQHQNQTPQSPYSGQFTLPQSPPPTDPSTQFFQNQNPQFQYNGQQTPIQYYQPVYYPQVQNQQQDPSQVYIVEGNSSGGDLASTAINILTNELGNPSNSPQSAVPTQQLPTPATSPFDPSQLQQSSGPSVSTLSFDPSTQMQQFVVPTPPPFDPSSFLQQQQSIQDQATTQIVDQAFSGSAQFTSDLLGQATFNASIQDDNSYIVSSSPTQDLTTVLAGQELLNASILADNSCIAPPSPTVVNITSDSGTLDMSQAFADQDSAIF